MGQQMSRESIPSPTSNLPIVEVNEVAFVNLSGGTGSSDSQFNSRLSGPFKVQVTNGWLDDEIGFRFIGISAEPRLDQYLEQVACATNRNVYFGQYDLIGKTSDEAAAAIISQLPVVDGN